MSVSFIDIFCGAGGSSLGLTGAGLELRLAANHWARAIETHAANFTDAEHLCADVNNYDMRRLPRAQVLWASPICQESSPAGGRRKKRAAAGQLDLLDEHGHVPAAGWERTRATAYDVIRATEVWGYDAVLIENVIEFATDWPLFTWWLDGMTKLGYAHRIVCVNSAHIGGEANPHAPQWRDRLYIVFLRRGVTMPDLEPRPLAYCFECGADVAARQTWKTHTALGRRRIGKYRDQYTYTCPNTARRHENFTVEPYVLPAAAAIDWTNLGVRIGDRPRPLKPNTMRRIIEGLRLTTSEPAVIQVNHAGHDGRAYPASAAPLACRTVRGGDGFIVPPLLVPSGGTWNTAATTVDEPMRTRTANPRGMEALVAPPFIAELRGGGSRARPAAHPLATITAGGNHHALITPPTVTNNDSRSHRPEHSTARDRHALVIPYRRGKAKNASTEPLHTVATRDSAALINPPHHPAGGTGGEVGDAIGIEVNDCRYRMLKAREHLRAQRFPDTYIVTGNQAEQTMQAGNAVSANVAHWLGTRIAEALS